MRIDGVQHLRCKVMRFRQAAKVENRGVMSRVCGASFRGSLEVGLERTAKSGSARASTWRATAPIPAPSGKGSVSMQALAVDENWLPFQRRYFSFYMTACNVSAERNRSHHLATQVLNRELAPALAHKGQRFDPLRIALLRHNALLAIMSFGAVL